MSCSVPYLYLNIEVIDAYNLGAELNTKRRFVFCLVPSLGEPEEKARFADVYLRMLLLLLPMTINLNR